MNHQGGSLIGGHTASKIPPNLCYPLEPQQQLLQQQHQRQFAQAGYSNYGPTPQQLKPQFIDSDAVGGGPVVKKSRGTKLRGSQAAVIEPSPHMNNNSIITNRSTSNQQQPSLTPQAPSTQLYNQQPNSQYTNYNNPNNFNNMVAAGQGMDVGYNSQMNNMGMHSQNSWNNQMSQMNQMGGGGGAMSNMSNMNGMMSMSSTSNSMPSNMAAMHGSSAGGGNMSGGSGMHTMNQMQMNGSMSMNSQMNGMGYSPQRHLQMNPMAQMANMGHGHQMNGMSQMNQMNPMAKMQGMANGYPRRMSPYPNPQLHAAQKRSMYGAQGPPASFPPQHQSTGVSVPIQSQPYGRPPVQAPINPYGRGPAMMPQQRQSTPPYNNAGQQYYGNAAGYQNMPGFQQDGRMNYQHSPVPGNPTPPLTPASSMTPYISPNPDIKPNISHNEDQLRLTFPVRDGIILPPFRLEHNLAVSNHVFQLKPTVYNTLMCRPDLELQLKCFHHEDRQMNTNWPASVQVSANSTPLEIDRGENKNTHRPLYLKHVCQPGRNTIQITVSTCCCSHLFVLQLVHRPSVRHVLHTLLRRNLLHAEHAVAKIKRSFAQGHIQAQQQQQQNPAAMPPNEKDGLDQQQSLKVFLKCPITCKRISLPARGHDCKHIQCFDLEAYLQINCERGNWRCPVCNKPALTEGLEIDQYMWAILSTLQNQTDTEEVVVDAQANWKAIKPMSINGVKQEQDHDSKQFNKVMSPGSTSLPSWDNMQAMSPYMSPDMNSIASGSFMGQNYNQRNQQFDSYGNPIKQEGPNGDFSSNGNGINPLAHLNDSVNSLDPLNAMEKSLNDQMPHTPHTPHTPNGSNHNPMTPGGPPSVPPSQNESSQNNGSNNNSPQHQHNMLNSASNIMNSPQSLMNSPQNMMNSPQNMLTQNQIQQNLMNSIPNLTDVDLNADLNFDPAAVIDGEGGNDLNLLPDDSVVDPMELLSYLDPPDTLNTPPSSGSSNNANNDDILAALFE